MWVGIGPAGRPANRMAKITIRMSHHARDRARACGITSDEVRRVIEDSEAKIQESLARQSMKARREIGGRRVVVVYAEKSINEITTYADPLS